MFALSLTTITLALSALTAVTASAHHDILPRHRNIHLNRSTPPQRRCQAPQHAAFLSSISASLATATPTSTSSSSTHTPHSTTPTETPTSSDDTQTSTEDTWTPTPSDTPAPSPTPTPEPTKPASSDGGGQVTTGGYGTFFYQNGVAGACGTVHSDSDSVFAMDSAIYNQGLCGKSVTITNVANGKTVTGIVADECPTCNNAQSIDMSLGAFQQLASLDAGLIGITWSFS
ncbi:hypothetical protein D9757_011310 [Collybiopsis confluens]|uniref:RlpA-like protein double-psi beta-barrel domain-containing protein n=1 Tax=Collybiopsis confluens TaxID=2823264 RepID=A0A8H5GNL0_9AGAR|nr:hypothetical protein D9757_011310 [Collybiopsis confluens]